VSAICGHFVQNGKIKSTDLYDMLKKWNIEARAHTASILMEK